jgi:hypothetical protein
MVTEKKEVEIIPLLHLFGGGHTTELVKYIQSLPKGATLFLEIVPTFLEKLKRYSYDNIKEDLQALTFFFVVKECMKKGINIVPLERISSFAIMDFRKKATSGLEYNKISARSNRLREKLFTSRIAKHIGTNADLKKTYAVVGNEHVLSLARELVLQDVNARVNFTVYKNPDALARWSRLSTRINDEYLRKEVDVSFIEQLELERFEILSLEMQSRLDSDELTDAAEKRELDVKKRVQRKLELKQRPKRPTLRV